MSGQRAESALKQDRVNLWIKILLLCVWWHKAISNKQRGDSSALNEIQCVSGKRLSLPFYYSLYKIIPITKLILALSLWCIFFYFTFPINELNTKRLGITDRGLTSSQVTGKSVPVCVCEIQRKRARDVTAWSPPPKKMCERREDDSLHENPHICDWASESEPGALCCGMFQSVHNCQNVIPVTQRSSKPALSILKTI